MHTVPRPVRPERVWIFDTTLRDGEQSPGFSMSADEKVEMARQLAHLGVDVIEAGFPVSSPGEFEAARRVAQEVAGPTVCVLARTAPGDIERAWEAVREAERPRIHTFIATSPIHMARKLRMSPEAVLESAADAVRLARRLCPEVEFSAEDATRSDVEFLCRVFEAAINAGAAVINIPDTVGYAQPEEFAALVRTLIERVPGMEAVTVSVHCHDDLGLATANTLAGIRAGARQVEGTINGIGERAGNAALEEVIMALHTRADRYGLTTGVDTTQIAATSRLLCALTGIEVQPNKAVVGANAFAHEAGIHQHGVLMDRATYEIMTPESVGLPANRLVLGKHSGRHALAAVLEAAGFRLSREEVDRVYRRFKEVADRKKTVLPEELVALVEDDLAAPPSTWELSGFEVTTGSARKPSAVVALTSGGRRIERTATGDGPVDAIFAAINDIVAMRPALVDYTVRAVAGGAEAVGEAVARLRLDGALAVGRASSTDVLEASARAYLAAINKLLARRAASVVPGGSRAWA
ncbi:MAG: 2-isopropylmalate synthase [Armatimonadota bacterium]|nr:2-isopropylmalate synthase [Armatimonadota bacterium]MDR7450447.1 2-isopropylmalate synthase [Armatimonadota bacterium]MDR7466970.1 2-isopropylmalate synthase [Armatimonadota bacterium]MDR7493488.1 2-isopropylmalate synthase [Armatimonadota bacterium]MDR7498753.1 2-isopropylmalate synthase [Armatimonadota bacterium]